jgi:hypothetical protein
MADVHVTHSTKKVGLLTKEQGQEEEEEWW